MTLEIITPNATIFSGKAAAVQLPGKDGLFQVLDNHAPIIAALKEGTIKIELPKAFEGTPHKTLQMVSEKVYTLHVNGGMVEMAANKIIVLAN
jgi:F-type H+-transporting ATPase subunit epsilon